MDLLDRRSFLSLFPKAAAAKAVKPMTNTLIPGGIFPVDARATPVGLGSATGAVTYTFPAISQGQEAQVSVVVPQSPVGAVWTINKNGVQIGAVVGNGPFGAFYISNTDVITVTGTSLLLFSNSITTLNPPPLANPGQAVMLGTQGPVGTLGPVAPTQGGGYPSGLTLLASNTSSGATGTPIITLSGNARGILVVAEQVPSLIPAFGQQLGPFIPVTAGAAQVQAGTGGVAGYWFLATMSTLEVQLDFAASTIYIVYEVDFDFDYMALVPTLPVNNVALPNPSAGADWDYTLLAPARLVGVSATLATSGTAANRYPRVAVGSIGTLATTAAQTAGTTVIYNGFTTAGAVDASLVSTVGVVNFPLPNYLLPTGAMIQSITTGLQTTDTWENVVLVLQAS